MSSTRARTNTREDEFFFSFSLTKVNTVQVENEASLQRVTHKSYRMCVHYPPELMRRAGGGERVSPLDLAPTRSSQIGRGEPVVPSFSLSLSFSLAHAADREGMGRRGEGARLVNTQESFG